VSGAPRSVFGRFTPRLQEAIVARLGWTSLRPVQEQAGAALLDGHNAVVLAPTAGGKTEAAMFPTLSLLLDDPPRGVGALYLAPIKALLNNQAERLGVYTEMVDLRRTVWHGDINASARHRFLADPSELLMTTPESLEVMLISRRVDTAALFADLRIVIVDEVHALAGTDRGAHLLSVVERLAALSRHDVQRVGLSATVGNPDVILAWITGTSDRPGVVVDPPKQPARREILVVHSEDRSAIALDAAKLARRGKSLFFCQSRSETEAVAEHLRALGTPVFVHHSSVSREERALAEESFHRGTDACIVATSTLELGIDVGDLDRVLQAEAPDTVSSFLQRMGRTGRRAGQTANTTFFCTTPETVLQAVAIVELARQGWVERVDITDRCWPVLVHQLLALALAADGVPIEQAWAHLSRVPDLAGISRPEFDTLITHMLADGGLREASGRLVLGPKAERRFGRKNFMELYAVFSSPQSYAVETTSGVPIGTLTQGFVDSLVEGVSCFLLGGRPWVLEQARHSDRRLIVERAPSGRKPTWGGRAPQFLGYEVCQAVLDLVTNDREIPYLHESARVVVQAERARFAGVVEPGVGGIEIAEEEGEIRWWTFAGGKRNAALRYALEVIGGDWKVIPDNFAVRVRPVAGAGEGVDVAEFRAAVARIEAPGFWEDEGIWEAVVAAVPAYRLSKFQGLMPVWVEREVLGGGVLGREQRNQPL
jgi:ATP-dependent helicase Lhr and Lhr-like helicase